MATLMKNIEQAIKDFDNIKQAIIAKGVEVPDGTKTSEYGNLIKELVKDDYVTIANFPLTENLLDTLNNFPDLISSEEIALSNQGAYLYDNTLSLPAESYIDLLGENEILLLEMDLAYYKSSKVFRRVFFMGNYGVEILANSNGSANTQLVGLSILGGISFGSSRPTVKTYCYTGTPVYYSFSIRFDFKKKTMEYLIDDAEGGRIVFDDEIPKGPLQFSSIYPLDGYIRNLKIKTK